MNVNSPKPNNKSSKNTHKFDHYALKGWSGINEKETLVIKKNLHRKVYSKYGNKTRFSFTTSFRLMLVAASIGIFILAIFLLDQEQPLQYAALNLEFPPTQILSTIPLAPEKGFIYEEKGEVLQSGVAYYKKGDFQTAAVYFKNYLKHNNTRHEVLLYYGQTLLDTDPQEAIHHFDLLINNADLDQVYIDLATWFKTIGLINVNEAEKAVQLLEIISNSRSSCKADATKLLLFVKEKQANE